MQAIAIVRYFVIKLYLDCGLCPIAYKVFGWLFFSAQPVQTASKPKENLSSCGDYKGCARRCAEGGWRLHTCAS